MSSSSQWAQQRREAAAEHERRLHERQRAEARKAQSMLDRFLQAANHQQLAAEPLVVQGYGGRGKARTPLRGWYLRVDRTCAVGTDGSFYVLTAPLSAWDRLRGVRPEPKDPPLLIGAGGKDGNAIYLSEALERLLPGWQDHPRS
ncbi:MAG TPA: hypothetical protein VK086_00945 [Ruania sp.]|nr:hypothetical protein [Ruania sp.]